MKRPFGVTVIATGVLLVGAYLGGKSLFALSSLGTPHFLAASSDPYAGEALGLWEMTVAFPFILGLVLLLTGWGLFRLRNWARFVSMLVAFVTAGAELPLLIKLIPRFSVLGALGILEFSIHLVVVWYLFKPSTVEVFLHPVKAA